MKSKVVIVVLLALFAAGASEVALFGEGPSYSDQLTELIRLRAAGLISPEEYCSVKNHIISVMLH